MLEQIHEILFEKKILDKNETIQNYSLLSDKYNVNTNYLETNKKKYILKTQNKINNQLPTLKNIYYDLRMFPLFSLRIYYCDQNMCLMEYIENDKYEINLNQTEITAKNLVKLHSQTSKFFGYKFDTYLGDLIQNNSPNYNWCNFFLRQRYDFYLNKIKSRNYLSLELFRKLITLRKTIKERLLEPNMPGLIHGDIWLQNILTKGNQVSRIIDPAVFYADTEYELAYIYQNGTFAKGFYERYNYYRPISDEFWNFKIYIYQIIPLMQYTLLESPIYLKEIEKLIDLIYKN